MMTSYHRNRFC